MQQFVLLIRDFWADIFHQLRRIQFPFKVAGMNLSVSLFELLLAFLVFSIVIGVFWKGAKA